MTYAGIAELCNADARTRHPELRDIAGRTLILTGAAGGEPLAATASATTPARPARGLMQALPGAELDAPRRRRLTDRTEQENVRAVRDLLQARLNRHGVAQ